jgi:flavin-dependent dehydrogenase
MTTPRSDVIVIGAGISGLTAAALLAKSGLKVKLLEQHYQPGGSCGDFRACKNKKRRQVLPPLKKHYLIIFLSVGQKFQILVFSCLKYTQETF